MIAEKDAGESYLDQSHLPDHLSGFYQLKNGGVLRHLVIGDYNVSFGQGLVMGQGMMVGKSNEVLKIKSSYSGIRRHLSTVESGYCRGAALLLGKRKFRFTTFGSFKEIDASSLIDTLFLTMKFKRSTPQVCIAPLPRLQVNRRYLNFFMALLLNIVF